MRPMDIVAERFVVERLAGEGGMGAVYRALDRETDLPVALKVMTSQGALAARRFAREAEVLRALSHPHIVRYVAHGATPSGAPFMAMEWLEGEDLEARLVRQELTLAESVSLATAVADALGAAHAAGVVHRDIKPSNLFLPEGDGPARVKVLDFGIARGGQLSGAATKTGGVIGTPGYMAPEQARGDGDIDARADVFSLGCVLFECIAQRPAFVGEHVVAILAKILLEEAPKLGELRGDVPEVVEEIVGRMLSKAREGRPANGAAVARALRELGDVRSAPGPRSAHPPSITRGEQRLLSVIVVGRRERDATLPGDIATRATVAATWYDDAALAPFDARGVRLMDGSVVVTLVGSGAATDQAARAARCALAIRTWMRDEPLSLATGRGEVSGRLPIGEVIDRAARLRRPDVRAIALDEVTAGLIASRFEVTGDARGLVLVGERQTIEATRTLLGKPTPCVGREREIAALVGIFDDCVLESATRAVLVTAAAGVGKSRVRYELLRTIAARNEPVEVWIGRGDTVSKGAPFGMIAPFLKRAAGVQDGEPIESRRRKLAARVARHVGEKERKRVTEFIGEIVGTHFPDEGSMFLRSARSDAQVMGDQTKRAWEDFLIAETSAQPVLIVLEDLHWGDLPSVTYLDAALRVVRERAWTVVAFARPEVDDLFPKLWAGRNVTRIALPELSSRAGEKLAREVLGEGVARETVDRIVVQAAGNAFYLEELIRAVAEGKGDALPGTVMAMLQSRIEGLDAETRRVLRAASVFGQVFWTGAVSALLGGEPTARDRLSELVDKEIVAEVGNARFRGETEYGFRHALVRAAAYGMLTDADRVLAHALAGKWLEGMGEDDALAVAEHYEQGGERAKAGEWFGKAAEQALEGNDLGEAISRVERAVLCGAKGEALAHLRLVQTEAHNWRGEFTDGAARGEQALALLPNETHGWASAAGEVARAASVLGNRERVIEQAAALRSLVEHALGGAEGVMAAARTAIMLFFDGDDDRARSLLATTEHAAARFEADPRVRARVDFARATRALHDGDTGEALARFAAAVAECEQAGEARLACNCRMNLGNAFLELGEYEEAEARAREVLADAHRMGLQHMVAYARQNLGMALARTGSLADALDVESSAVDAFVAQGDAGGEATSRIYLAEIHALSCRWSDAESGARVAIDVAEGHPPRRALALAMLARVLLANARSSNVAAVEAVARTTEALSVLEALGGIDEGESLVRLTHAEALHRTGNLRAAHSAMSTARVRLLSRAAKISVERYRGSFLERVPENARTMQLARHWCRET